MPIPGILMQLVRNNPMIGQAKQMMAMLKAAQNPQMLLNQMISTNPKMKEVMDLVNQYGGDPNKALQAVAQQNGIDPKEIMDMLK